jgi:hypothetical protein
MIGRLILYFAIAAAAYWYWSGPYQDGLMSDYERELEQNNEKMSLCVRGKNYNAGATGDVSGIPEDSCAQEYNFYLKDGQWHSYKSVRQD